MPLQRCKFYGLVELPTLTVNFNASSGNYDVSDFWIFLSFCPENFIPFFVIRKCKVSDERIFQ